jgi:hypothetical protein
MGYSSVLEAHIEVLQGLQKVSAYTEDMFGPEEIDLQLHRQQERLLEEIVNKRFQDMQVGLDYIRPLIVKNKSLKVILPEVGNSYYEPNMVYGVLPPDYIHLVNDRSLVTTSTAAGLCDDLTAFKADPANKATYVEKVAVLPFPETNAISAPYYYKTTIEVNATYGTVVYTLPAGLNNLKSANSWFSVVSYILESLSIAGLEVYWEKYRNLVKPKSFIFVNDGTDNEIYSVLINSETGPGNSTSSGRLASEFVSTSFKVPNYGSLSQPVTVQVDNILTETDEFYTQNLNTFYKTRKTNPKTQVSGDFLLAYESNSFLISGLYIDYVRKPRHVSLSLNQNFELAGDGPRIVVDRTVEFLKLAIENPTYQAVLNDNKTRNQI